jgi:hypothetical protein
MYRDYKNLLSLVKILLLAFAPKIIRDGPNHFRLTIGSIPTQMDGASTL